MVDSLEGKIRLERFEGNPILSPEGNSWKGRAVFNPGAVMFDGQVHILYRAVGKDQFSRQKFGRDYVSVFCLAKSDDGFNITEDSGEPVIVPEYLFESAGVEDARVMKIGDHFFITYTGLQIYYDDPARQRVVEDKFKRFLPKREKHEVFEEHRDGKWFIRACMARTDNFKTYDKLGIVLPNETNKDIVLVPEPVNGRNHMYHRREPDIWIADAEKLSRWGNHKLVLPTKPDSWKEKKVGASCPPIKTEKGWLLFYHGVDDQKVYRVSAAMFALDDPARLVNDLDYPILEPEEEYELHGDVDNVVFPCGVVEKDGRYILYYGGADTYVGAASIDKKKMLDAFD